MSTVSQDQASALPERRVAAARPPGVLVVADHLGYPGGVVHGVTSYFLGVLPALARAGVDVKVCFVRDPHPAADELRAQGIEPVFLSAARINPLVALQIAGMARRGGCTILHAMGIKAILMARLASHLVPARTLLHFHDLVEPNAVVGKLQRIFARPSDMAACVSSAIVPIAIRRYNVRPDRVRVVHNGIDLERFRQVPDEARARVRSSLGIEQGRPVMLMAGRMHPIKGHRAMLRMMPAILQRCPDAFLLVAGDGPERSACESIVQELRLERTVRFLGQRRDIPDLLKACDMVVVPSESEGFCMAAVEASAVERPTVAFDCGGVSDVITHGSTGLLVPAGASDAFADAAAAMLLDADRRALYGRNASASAARFGLDRHVRQLLDVYDELQGPVSVLADGATA